MKSKELIRQLIENDPSGETEVCVGNVDIHFVSCEPAYYDGSLQVLIRDETNPYYNITGAKYKRKGNKVQIHTLSISDVVIDNVNCVIDYSELPTDQAERTKKSHEELKKWYVDMTNRLELESFINWAKDEAKLLTEDIEDIEGTATFLFNKNKHCKDTPLPGDGKVPLGKSYNETRIEQWKSQYEVSIKNGFLVMEERT